MSGAAQTARMVTRAPEARSALPIRVPAPAARTAQAAAAVRVSQPAEPAEREAERVARRVVAMPAAAAAPMARRLNALVPAAPAAVPSALGVGSSVGQPLPRRVQRDMEPRFGADFSSVRVHTGDTAARTSRRLNAAAFTVGRDVFFGRGRFQPDSAPGRGLLAHELTHTIQQGAAAQPAAVQRSMDTTVHERSTPRVQRLGVQDALDYFAEKAEFIPGFSMLALLLGFNPVSLRSAPRTAANLLRALIRLLPGGALITQALDNHGIVERVAAWAEGQLAALGDIGSAIRQSIDEFLDGLGWSDIFDLGGVWERAKRIVTAPIDRIITFGSGLVSGIVTFIKDAILRPLASLIEPTRGYPLLKAVLGFDPVTGDAVPRNATTLLGGFMTLIGQDEVWQNIQRGNAIDRAWAWFQGAVTGYLGFVTQIPSLFLDAFRSLELLDIVLVPRALAKVIGVFGSFYGRLFSWALGTVISLLEIILSVVAPGALEYLRRAGAAFQSILRNPVGFCLNLVRAAKAGLQRFAGNFLKHLVAGLLDWLTDSLPGIHIPQSFSLTEIFKFVMSVLGLTWGNLRAKLVREVGEPAVLAMEKGFEIVVTLVRDGPVAAWEQIKESLSNLKQMAIDGIMDMVVDFVVIKAIPKLVALFIPGPGFITAAIAIYDTVMTFMRQLSRLAHLVKGYIDAIVAIASGSIDTAAAAVEAQAARYLSLAITILAGMAGFGKVSKRVQDVLERIRKPIDKAMDRVVGWVVGMARRAGMAVVSGVQGAVAGAIDWWRDRVPFTDDRGTTHSVAFKGSEANAQVIVESTPRPLLIFLASVGRTVELPGNERYRPFLDSAVYLAGEINRAMDALRAVPRGADKKEKEEFTRERDLRYGVVQAKIKLLVERPLRVLLALEAAGATAVSEGEAELNAEAAHQYALGKMRGENLVFLRGHRGFAPGHAGRTFTLATRNAVDAIGYVTGDHSTGVTAPGTDASTALPGSDSQLAGRGHWVPDHQPPDELLAGGAKGLTFRFYPHARSSATHQGGVVRSYKDWVKKKRARKDADWAEGLQSRWFW